MKLLIILDSFYDFRSSLDLNYNFYLTFSHPWETVAQAAWRKYPNPMNTAVVATDVVERTVVDGVLHTHRLVSSRWYFPSWAQRVSFKPSEINNFSRAILVHIVHTC